MGIKFLQETTQRASNRPYLMGIILALLLFIVWQLSNILVFDLLAGSLDTSALGILDILRGFANAVVIAIIIVSFSSFISRVEAIQQTDQLNILNNMNDGLLEINNTGIILFANDQINKLLQVPSDVSLEGKSFSEILPIKKDVSNFGEYVKENIFFTPDPQESFKNKEFLLKSFKNDAIPVLGSATYLKSKDKFLLIFTNIKELKQTQNEVQYLMHVEKISSLGHLVGGISHEINNPLAFLINDFSRLKEYIQDMFDICSVYSAYINHSKKVLSESSEYTELKEKLNVIETKTSNWDEMKDDIEEIIENHDIGLKRITKVVKDLRQYSSMGSPSKKDFHQLNKIISFPLSLIKDQYVNRIDVVDNLDPNIPEISINPDRISQVVMNLLLNATQAIENRGSIKVTTYQEESTGMICLEISDTGSGIPDEYLDKIFDPYFTTKDSGTGLGLGIVKNIIDDHNGKIFVESEDGKGSKFIVKLPKSLNS